MNEMTRPRSLFHTFLADNDGWHVTAVDMLSADNLEGSRYVHRQIQINACTVSAPVNLQLDHGIQQTTVNWVGGEPGLAFSACNNYQQLNKLLTHGPLHGFRCSQCSTHMHISKIDNG